MIIGEATIGLEIIRQLPEVDGIVIPKTNSSLAISIAFAIKTLQPDTKIIVCYEIFLLP